jgi:HD-GYP domain-containing protein (c-di-GMP phosphodiesterase class II)
VKHTIEVKDIRVGSFFSEPVYLDEGFILLTREMQYTRDMAAALREWGFSEVLTDGEMRDTYMATTSPGGGSFVQNDADRIDDAQKYYDELLKWAAKIYLNLKKGSTTVTFDYVSEKVRELCDYMKINKNYMLLVRQTNDRSEEGAFASHAVWTTIIAIVIGMQMKLSVFKLFSLGTAALMHEVGMISIPPQIYMTGSPLGQKEELLMKQHTVFGFDLLKQRSFPVPICLAALEHHEWEDGSGYPNGLKSDKTSVYSKIVAVACSYAAITEARPYRGARDGNTGIVDLLRNVKKRYNDIVVRMLVMALSIYPIGQFVELSSGKIGQVVSTGSDPRYPVVQIFGEITPDGKNAIVETSADGIFIAKPLDRMPVAPA